MSWFFPSDTHVVVLNNASWIHGTDNNPIFDLANLVGATTFSPPERGLSFYDETGSPLAMDKAAECSGLLWSMVDDAYKYSNDNCSSIPSNKSLLDFFEVKLKEMKKSDSDTKIVLQMARMWGDYVGDPVERQSLKYFWLEESIDGGRSLQPVQRT